MTASRLLAVSRGVFLCMEYPVFLDFCGIVCQVLDTKDLVWDNSTEAKADKKLPWGDFYYSRLMV